MQRGFHLANRLVRPLGCHIRRIQHTFQCIRSPISVNYYSSSSAKMSYSIIEKGCPNTLEYRIFFAGDNGPISPFHDIPLWHNKEDGVFNMVVEVPRWTNAKMEIDTKNRLNPIKQDVKKGKLRYVHNCFPHHGYIWNYGALPQTWEDPSHKDEHTGENGDNDPLDVCEIGHKVHKRGDVIQVKILGIMAMIDEGETDWKVLAIDVTDPIAEKLNDVEDIEKLMPGFLKATNEWFRIYKIPSGKPENHFAFNGEAKNKEFAHQIINETHESWQKLVNNQCDSAGISCENMTVAGSSFKINAEDAHEEVNKAPVYGDADSISSEVDQWHYITL